MWLWKKFWNTDIIGKIYILIILFIIIVATITIITRSNNKSILQNNEIANDKIEKQETISLNNNEKNITENEKITQNDSKKVLESKKDNEQDIIKKVEKETAKATTTNSSKKNKDEKKTITNQEKQEIVPKEQQEEKIEQTEYIEYEVSVAEEKECKDGKHLISVGNSERWFKTKQDADNFYNQEIAKYDDDKIPYEEYLKNCPSRIRNNILSNMSNVDIRFLL